MSLSKEEFEPCGVLPLVKPVGMTSHDAVNRIRRLYGLKRVGHTGTLDPDASGLLVILVGRAAKAAEYITAADKTYRAVLRLGVTTDTGDASGRVLSQCETLPGEEAVLAALMRFQGEIMQVPPMYSALKRNGQKLVDLARKGIEVAREARPVTIYALRGSRLSDSDYALEVRCSKGTYIRTLCEDIGQALGCGGMMAALERTASGSFSLSEACTLEQLEAMSGEARLARLKPVEALFDDCPTVMLGDFFARLARSGCEIYQKKIGCAYPAGKRVKMADAEGFFALGEVGEYPDGSAIKALKLFRLAERQNGKTEKQDG